MLGYTILYNTVYRFSSRVLKTVVVRRRLCKQYFYFFPLNRYLNHVLSSRLSAVRSVTDRFHSLSQCVMRPVGGTKGQRTRRRLYGSSGYAFRSDGLAYMVDTVRIICSNNIYTHVPLFIYFFFSCIPQLVRNTCERWLQPQDLRTCSTRNGRKRVLIQTENIGQRKSTSWYFVLGFFSPRRSASIVLYTYHSPTGPPAVTFWTKGPTIAPVNNVYDQRSPTTTIILAVHDVTYCMVNNLLYII